MTDSRPIACSLGASELQQRFDEIAEVGAASLLGRDAKDGKHTLCFRRDATTRARLEKIVFAEAACCSFLDLELVEHEDKLILTLIAPGAGQPVADGLAAAFARASSLRI
jgi:hypothetical protein